MSKMKKISDKEKDLSIEERARRAAYRISRKYEKHNAEEPDQAAAGKTNEKGERKEILEEKLIEITGNGTVYSPAGISKKRFSS